MKKKSSFANWDFNNTWVIVKNRNSNYPILRWQMQLGDIEENGKNSPELIIVPSYESDMSLQYDGDGYIPNNVKINFTVSSIYDSINSKYSSLDNVQLRIELPEEASFSSESSELQKIYNIGTLDDTNYMSNIFSDIIYLNSKNYSESINISFYATADGYNDEYKTQLSIPVTKINDVDYSNCDMLVYSEIPDCKIGKNQTCALLPILVDNGSDDIIKDDSWSYEIADKSVVGIEQYVDTEYGTGARIIGLKSGHTQITIHNLSAGKKTAIDVWIMDDIISYDISDLINYSNGEGTFNSGIFVNSYSIKKVKDGYLVSFNAYNGYSAIGAVEVYDKNNNLCDVKKIKKFSRYQTKMKEVITSGWNLCTSAVDGTLSDFTNSMYSEETKIENLFVPNNGHIIISNDIKSSEGALFYNAIDISYWTMQSIFVDAAKLNDNQKDIIESNIADKIQSKILGTNGNKDILNRYKEKLIDSIVDDVSLDYISNITYEIYNISAPMWEELEIDMFKEVTDAMANLGLDITTEVLTEEITGKYIKGMFTADKYLNRFMQVADIVKITSNSNNLRIIFPSSFDKLVSDGISIEYVDNVSFNGEELIVKEDTDEVLHKYVLQRLSDANCINIYDISLYKDHTQVQPSGKIRVRIPLPVSYLAKKSAIFRMEDDNTLTNMNAIYSDGYLIFETEHLSKYVIYEKFSYQINFDGNGSNEGSMSSLLECEKNVEYQLPNNSYKRAGYNFIGWNTIKEGNGMQIADNASVSNLTNINDQIVVLFAQWVPQDKTKEDDNSNNSLIQPNHDNTLSNELLGLDYFTKDNEKAMITVPSSMKNKLFNQSYGFFQEYIIWSINKFTENISSLSSCRTIYEDQYNDYTNEIRFQCNDDLISAYYIYYNNDGTIVDMLSENSNNNRFYVLDNGIYLEKSIEGNSIVIKTNKWISVNRKVMDYIQLCGMDIKIVFLYKNKQYLITIPSNSDLFSLLQKADYYGFMYLFSIFGGEILND